MLRRVMAGFDLNVACGKFAASTSISEHTHARWQTGFRAVDSTPASHDVSPVCRALSRAVQGPIVLVLGSVPGARLRTVDLPREPARHRSIPASPRLQALPYGHSRRRGPKHAGQRQHAARLTYLRR